MSNNIKAVLLGLMSFVCFSSFDAINRYMLSNKIMGLPIFFTYVKLGTVLILLTIGLLIYKKHFFYVKNKKIVLIRSIIGGINLVSVAIAVYFLPLDIFYPIVFTMPLFSIMAGILFLGEKFSILKLVVIIIGFTGVYIIVSPVISNSIAALGIIFALITALSGSAVGIIARKYLQQENPWTCTFYALSLGLIIGIAMTINDFRSDTFTFALPSYASLFIIIIASTVAAFASVLYLKAYQIGQANFVAPTQYSQLFWGTIFGIFIFDDIPTTTTIIGCFIIIAANCLNFLNYKKIKN